MSAELNGRKVLVTGGASGIGGACAAAFAAAGAAVTVADLDERGARKVAEPLGGAAVGVDLADRAFDAAALAGGMDVVVNNAGIQHVAPVEDFPEEKFRLIIALMLEAPFRLARAALPHMYAEGWGVHGIPESEVIEKIMLTEPAVKRLVEPAEVANLAVLLCGPSMSFANGGSYPLDGGWTAR
jgi:3-hydroxybutyrate dehydrogenase